MKLQIQKIRLHELENFIKSKVFKEFEVIPITEHRAISYLNNPNAQPDDVVLYLGFVNKQLIAFRTIFADKINTTAQIVRFGWCSGNWVHPEFRRKGFSEQLLNAAFSDWNGKLMFTNYAPNSENLYIKTGKFHSIHQFNGFRGYLFPKTKKLIPAANRNVFLSFIFSLVDFIISIVSHIRLWFFRKINNPKIRFEILPSLDEFCFEKLKENKNSYLFSRSKKELEWIFNFPWIENDKNLEKLKYPFSSWSSSFSYFTVKIFAEGKPAGFSLFSVREGHLKTLLMYFPKRLEREIAGFIKSFSKKNKIEVVTVYNSEIANHLFKRKFPFLHAKKYGQKIYSSFEIKDEKQFHFQDGDGDVIFT